jgi:uncharacterized protein (TIRG00374 family)
MTARAEGAGQLSGWRYRTVIFSVGLAALGYLASSLWVGWRDVLAAVEPVGLVGLAVVLSLSLANYSLRFLRWQAYLGAMGYSVPWGPSLRIYLAGFALTTTPGKAGELLRGVLLKRRGVPYPVSFAAFFSERLSDLLAIVLLALLGLSTYPQAQSIVVLGAALVILGLLLLTNTGLARLLAARVTGPSRLARFALQAFDVLQETRRCHAPVLIVVATVLSLFAWAAEAWAFHLVLGYMSVEVSLAFAVFVYAVSTLAGALSFLPGGLGGAEAAMVGLLAWHGVGSADAVAATLLIRLATLWFAVAIGCVMLLPLVNEDARASQSRRSQ